LLLTRKPSPTMMLTWHEVCSSDWLFGMTLGSISILVSSLGETLLRLSRLRAESASEVSLPWMRPLWFVGILGVVLAAPFDAMAFVYAPMTSIITLYAFKQIVLVFFARVILREQIHPLCMLGILLSASGAAISLRMAPHRDQQETFEFPQDFFQPQISIYLGASAIILAALATLLFYPSQKANRTGGLQLIALPLISSWIGSTSKLFNAGLGLLPMSAHWYDLQWIWMPGAVVVLAILVFVVNVASLERMSTHIFMPLVFGFTAIITGVQGFLSGEFAGMLPVAGVWWCFGMLSAIVGTCLVAKGSSMGEAGTAEQGSLLECGKPDDKTPQGRGACISNAV